MAAKFRTDRAACSGHHHTSTAQVVRDFGDVGVDAVSAQQIGFVELAKFADSTGGMEEIIKILQDAHLDVCRDRRVNEVADCGGSPTPGAVPPLFSARIAA